MKICIVVDNLSESAGWGRLARKLGQGMTSMGHDVGFIVNYEDNSSNDVMVVPMRNLSLFKPWQYIISIYQIRKYISRYEIVVCFDANPYGIFTSIALLGSKTKYWLYCIGTYSLLTKNLIKDFLIRFAYFMAGKIIVVGNFTLSQINRSGLVVKNFSFLPVGVDDNFFYRVDNHTNLVEGKYILSVGGIKFRKGFHLSIEAFSNIANTYPDIKYVIVGKIDDNDYYESLLRLVSDAGLEGRVVFLSFLTDEELRSLYSNAEFFLLTPVTNDMAFEGFGMVYLEAAMCGLASIGSNNSGASEAILDKETGLLVDPKPEQIADAIMFMLDNKKIVDGYARRAFIRSKSFSWQNVYKKLSNFLTD